MREKNIEFIKDMDTKRYTLEEWIAETDEKKCEILNRYKKAKKTNDFGNDHGLAWSTAVQKTNCYKEITADGEIYMPKKKKEENKENKESIYKEQINYLFDVKDKTQAHKKVSSNINEEIIKEIKDFQSSRKNIYGLSLGEIIEMSLRIFLEKVNEETEEEIIRFMK